LAPTSAVVSRGERCLVPAEAQVSIATGITASGSITGTVALADLEADSVTVSGVE
jgi:hypothetical protein